MKKIRIFRDIIMNKLVCPDLTPKVKLKIAELIEALDEEYFNE